MFIVMFKIQALGSEKFGLKRKSESWGSSVAVLTITQGPELLLTIIKDFKRKIVILSQNIHNT